MNREMLIAILWMLPGGWQGTAQERPVVAVMNYARVPRQVLAAAVALAGRTLRPAGVEAEWTICDAGSGGPSHCTHPLPAGEAHLTMNVMPRMVDEAPGLTVSDMAGYALNSLTARKAPRAYAFYDKVQSMAAKSGRDLYGVLGCVIMHEVGHMLGLPHATSGVMQARIGPHDVDDAMAGWAFSGMESKQLRAGLDRVQRAMGGAVVAETVGEVAVEGALLHPEIRR